jgi:hypothetical protein
MRQFIYTGQSCEEIPRDVTHVKVVDLSVKVINEEAFAGCTRLRSVELCEGLEIIDDRAFKECTSLRSIHIPSTVKEIREGAFEDCFALRNVELLEGLEWIREMAFSECISLERITIPSTVKVIHQMVFIGCNRLMNVELNEGLELIEGEAFEDCSSLERIIVPSTVDYIAGDAFEGCERLVAVEFCDEIEQFVNEASLHWWNNGILKASLRTYSFLVEGNIPARLDTIKVRAWKKNIHNLLQRIPEKLKDDDNSYELDDNEEGEVYFNSIKSRLSNYEHLQDALPLLELALWKAKIMEQCNGNNISNVENDVKLMCRANSFSMLPIIFSNVIPFL